MNNLLKIQDLMRDIFDDERLEISETTSPDDVAEWDSFANIQLLSLSDSTIQCPLFLAL